MSSTIRNGADALTDTLLANGIDVCFANPGTSEMHFVGALDRKPQMRCVLGLFEGVVTGAADGYARMLDKPAATLLHTGPGLANGLANIHNAKRAQTPMVNIIGDHATHHLAFDAPLTSDIEGLAKPMSHWVKTVASVDDVSNDAAQAIAAARTKPGQIASLILPADVAWTSVSQSVATIVRVEPPAALPPSNEVVTKVAKALVEQGVNAANTTILVSGLALRTRALNLVSQIAQTAGVRLMAQQANSRTERGAGRVPIDRVPYSVDLALKTFATTTRMILVGAKAPVGFFAYPGKPSSMLPTDCEVIELVSAEQDIDAALMMLADALRVAKKLDSQNKATAIDSTSVIAAAVQHARLNPANISQIVAALIPDNAIVCEEAVSSGRDLFPATWGSAPHDWIQITGGAIGLGLPLALGAAIACPNRKVIDLQADGSGMYTLQALWTMARERSDVLVLLYSNRRYNILLGELKAVGAAGADGKPGYNASRMLDLIDPSLDWVHLAKGMGVDAARVETPKQLADLMASALTKKGPFLIEMVID
jgi:acetolactate synthase I/II/III large subunit